MSGERMRKSASLWGCVWGLIMAFVYYLFHKLGLSETHSAIVVLSIIFGGLSTIFEGYAVDIVSALKENK